MQVFLQTFPFRGGAAMLLAALACGLGPEVQAQMPPPPAMRALPGSPSGPAHGPAPGAPAAAAGALAPMPLRTASAPPGEVMRDLSATQQMQLQPDLERRKQVQNALSNVVKKSTATGSGTTANIK